MGSNTAWNWIKTSNDFPLKIIGGDVEIDNGYLSVGGTTTSTTRYGVWEFANEDLNNNNTVGWRVEDVNNQASVSIGRIDFPSGATNVNIYAMDWDLDAYHEDEGEWWRIELIVASSVSSSPSSSDELCHFDISVIIIKLLLAVKMFH